jgi:uncharacterized phage-associated protein
MVESTRFLFDVDIVAAYLHKLNSNISPIKLQKGLYFLFAYHGAVYARKEENGVFEGNLESNSLLFDAKFEAWQYGPVIQSVYSKHKNSVYSDHELIKVATNKINEFPEAKKFIDELFSQINQVSDFKLVDRSHEDNSWREAFKQGQSTIMDNDSIVNEYATKYINEN